MKLVSFFAQLFVLLAWLLAAPASRAQLDLVSSTGLKLTALSDGSVQVFDASGAQLMLFDGYRFTLGSVGVTTGGATATTVTLDGKPALQLIYSPTGGVAGTAITGFFILWENTVRIRFDIEAPSVPDNTTLRVRAIPAGVDKTTAHESFWVRHAGGGVPYETSLLKGFRYTFSPSRYALLHAPGYLPWNDAWSAHLPPASVAPGQWRAEAAWVLIDDPALRPHVGAALLAGKPLSLDLWTAQPYNLWNGSAASLALDTQTYNASAVSREITLGWWARNFAGAVVASGSETFTLPSGAFANRTLSFPPPARGLLFVEVSAGSGADLVFNRTNLAVLPPHTFASSDQLFGLANTFQLPDRASELALLKRMGVRSLRYQKYSATEAASIGLRQSAHSNYPDWPQSAVPTEWIDDELIAARDGGAPYWEVSNETNLNTSGTAATYVANFLAPARARRDVLAPGVGLTLAGIAGWSSSYLRALYDAGAWNHIDAFAFHPGRGNFTADYPGENGQVASPNTWNFLGTIRNYKNAVASYPPKPLHITEAYACTQPNSGWTDTYRNAADAVVLSYALAKEEGVAVMHFYQLNDTVWNDVGGVDPTDDEYHYGLLNRDLSPKPSLLAYATAAENLEGAVFKRWMSFDDRDQHGLMFDTPRGPLAVLWDRGDGYVLNFSASAAEPWVNRWTSSSTVALPLPLATDLDEAEPLYSQPFDNAGTREINIAGKPGWTVYIASTGAATTTPKIQVGGVIYSSPAANNGLVFVDTGLDSIPFPQQGEISLDTIASSNTGRVRLLVRLENGEWFASNTVFTPATASSWSNAFANGLEYRRLLRLGLGAAEWSRFHFSPGAPMGVGAALDADLPALPITGIGWYVVNESTGGGLTARFDNLVVRGSGGRSLRVLNPIGQVSYAPGIDGRAGVTLDGSPRLVHGLDADAGLDVVMDNAGPAAAATGSWSSATATAADDFYATSYAHDGNTGKGAKTFRFTPHLGVGGSYRVDLWWTAAADRATNVPVTVNHAGGASTTMVNQQVDGGRWVALGAYTFNKGFGGNVTISNAGTNGYVIADAVRFVALTDERDAFTRWVGDIFTDAELSDPSISGPLATPFGEGVPNLLRAALGLGVAAPNVVSVASALPSLETAGDQLALRFRQRRGGRGVPGVDYTAGGLRYLVEVSDDLVTWRSGADQVALVGAPTALDAEMESVLVRRLLPISGGARSFMRLRITRIASPAAQ